MTGLSHKSMADVKRKARLGSWPYPQPALTRLVSPTAAGGAAGGVAAAGVGAGVGDTGRAVVVLRGVAQEAVSAMPVAVSRSRTSTPGDASLSRTNIYIRGLASSTTDQDLMDLCSEYGNIVSTKAVMDLATKQCKGYGFVDFKDEESATNALNGLLLRKYQAQMAKQQEIDSTNLFFENLPPYHDEKHIADLLTDHQCGPVISTRVRRTADGISTCQGFARLASREKCEQAIAALNDKFVIDGHPLPLIVRFAECSHRKTRPSSNAQGLSTNDTAPFSGLPLAMGSHHAAIMAGLHPFSIQAPVPAMPGALPTAVPAAMPAMAVSAPAAGPVLPGYSLTVSQTTAQGMYPYPTLPPSSPFSALPPHPTYSPLPASPAMPTSPGVGGSPMTGNPSMAGGSPGLVLQYCHRHLSQRLAANGPQMLAAPMHHSMPSHVPLMLDPSQAPPGM